MRLESKPSTHPPGDPGGPVEATEDRRDTPAAATAARVVAVRRRSLKMKPVPAGGRSGPKPPRHGAEGGR